MMGFYFVPYVSYLVAVVCIMATYISDTVGGLRAEQVVWKIDIEWRMKVYFMIREFLFILKILCLHI